ncbi:MAG TPA: hypothetical protein VFY31_04105 [Macromonas sp.]|nr:hypothetical protein [Macromonas sp.]
MSPATPLLRHAALLGGALALVLSLGGCASVLRLENEVQSYARWPAQQTPATGDLYRFERLLSQQQSVATQDELEALTRDALDKVGLRWQASQDGQPVKWTVQVSARSLKFRRAPWADPRDDWPHWGGGVLVGRGSVFGGGMFPVPQPPYYQREVSLVLRRAGSSEVVYETKASQDGPWPDSPTLWSALLDAALDGFPQPPATSNGKRQVVIEVPR